MDGCPPAHDAGVCCAYVITCVTHVCGVVVRRACPLPLITSSSLVLPVAEATFATQFEAVADRLILAACR